MAPQAYLEMLDHKDSQGSQELDQLGLQEHLDQQGRLEHQVKQGLGVLQGPLVELEAQD